MANANAAYADSGKPGNPAYNVCRQVPTPNGVNQRVTIPSTNITGDYEFECVVGGKTFVDEVLIGAGGATPFIRIADNNTIRIQTATKLLLPTFPSALPTTGDHTIAVKRVGTNVSVSLNGVFGSTVSAAVESMVLDRLWEKDGIFFFNSSMRNVKLWNNGDRSTGTLVLDMPLNDGFVNNPVAVNLAGTDGVYLNATSAMWSEVCE